MFVKVLVPPLADALTYAVPEALRGKVVPGSAVQVPLGRRERGGYVIAEDLAPPTGVTVKEIKKLTSDHLHFLPSQLPFFTWVADYYGAPLANVLEVAIPPHSSSRFARSYSLTTPPTTLRGVVQRSLVEYIAQHKCAVPEGEPIRLSRGASSALKKLVSAGVLSVTSVEEKESYRQTELPGWTKKSVELHALQAQARDVILGALDAKQFSPVLLHGVTGSGKTEVYIEAVLGALERGRGALVIVPEIALTPQLIDRFRARVGVDIAVLHSGLSKRVRWDSWRALVEGRCRVAIGARSGIFAPVAHLGLIIVDEEHDGSYKQSDGLRYHARDLAIVRAQEEQCPVVLGSATPSLESYHRAITKKYHYIELPSSHSTARRADMQLVDMSKKFPTHMPSRSISPELFEALTHTLARSEQAFVLYNRRGFAAYLQCDRCARIIECPNCSVALTFHQEINALLCHHCSYSTLAPRICPECATTPMPPPSPTAKNEKEVPKGEYVPRGAGTEKVYEELTSLFPHASIARLDRDTALDIEAYKKILDDVRTGTTHILVGTQMIAKGHDLPGVTLVGIVDCDVGLHMPDFRAGERSFQLLTQAAGRAGRGERPGTIVLQTRSPHHASLLRTVDRDYPGFARLELTQRKELGYPPYTRMLRVLVTSPERSYPVAILERFKEHLAHQKIDNLTVLGPIPAPLVRLKGEWRSHLLLKSPSVKTILTARALLQSLRIKTTKVRIVFDLDPQEMM